MGTRAPFVLANIVLSASIALSACPDMTNPAVDGTDAPTPVILELAGGLILARGNGTAWAVAESNELRDSVNVQVEQVPASMFVSASDTLQEALGDAVRMVVSVFDEGGSPVAVATSDTYSQVVAGLDHTCAVVEGAAPAQCWGANLLGALGNGTMDWSNVPVNVLAGIAFAALTAGARYTCGWSTDGLPFCWGDNDAAQLGDGTTTARWSPVVVDFGSGSQ